MFFRTMFLALAVAMGVFGGNESYCVIEPTKVSVVNGAGKMAWSHSLQGGVDMDWSRDQSSRCLILPDGSLVFVHVLAKRESEGMRVLKFTKKGKLVRQLPVRAVVYDERDVPYSEIYWVNQLILLRGKSVRFVVSANHREGAPNWLLTLDENLNQVSEYWHPGHLLTRQFAELAKSKVLLFGGVNNGEHAGTVVVFDISKHISGTPQAMADTRFAVLRRAEGDVKYDVGIGNEIARVIFPRGPLSVAEKHPYVRVVKIEPKNGDLLVTVTASPDAHDARTVMYKLGADLQVLGIRTSKEFDDSLKYEGLNRDAVLGEMLLAVKTIRP